MFYVYVEFFLLKQVNLASAEEFAHLKGSTNQSHEFTNEANYKAENQLVGVQINEASIVPLNTEEQVNVKSFPFFYPNTLPPEPALIADTIWIPPSPYTIVPYDCSVSTSQAEQQLEAENAVAALVAEVSRAAAASNQLAETKTKQKRMAQRRMTGFYPAKVKNTGENKRDEMDIGFAFDIASRPSRNQCLETKTSFAKPIINTNEGSRLFVSMARYITAF